MTQKKIEDVVNDELRIACHFYGNSYHSNHEAYAVLLEEVEEAEQNLDYIKNRVATFWDDVKADNNAGIKSNIRILVLDAIELAAEACQVAAVAKKIVGEVPHEEK